MAGRKPFHESIVQAISDAENKEQLEVLAKLLLTTEIPRNHAAIRDTLKAKMLQVGAIGQLYKGVLRVLDDASAREELLQVPL
ncbi:MAG: hypothetical protein Q7R55_01135 [Candidatus Wildermuthbacteria bacterium]|nr:hypothetical protein [Candidatus Wildermuthbacteria bacterium]